MQRLTLILTLVGILVCLTVPVVGSNTVTLPTEADVQEIITIESENASPETSMPTFSPAGEQLIARMRDGFLKVIRKESTKWYACGVATPEEDKALRAEKIARYTLDAMREYNTTWLNPWAPLAVIYSESRGDQCAIGPNSRKAARELNLIDPSKPFNGWTKDDIVNVINHPKWKKSRAKIGADLGLGQQVWQRYARVLDPDGKHFCGSKDLRCRVPSLDEILSVEDGPRVITTGMITRNKMFRSKRPWEFWPGARRSLSYDIKITSIIRALGGSDGEKIVW